MDEIGKHSVEQTKKEKREEAALTLHAFIFNQPIDEIGKHSVEQAKQDRSAEAAFSLHPFSF